MPAGQDPQTNSTALIRTIGRWSLTALVINSVIGSGIFGLPSVISGRVGRFAPIAYFIAGAGMAVISGCLAEVASQFHETGGPYLYARETLGRFWGIQIAWMMWLSRIAAASGTANLFTTYLGQVFPRATEPAYRLAILTTLVGFLAVVNYVGVKSGARASDFFTILKLSLLGLFIAAGLWWIGVHGPVTSAPLTHAVEPRDWLEATLVLVYAYGGFEAVLLASGEMRDPRHDIPIALMIGFASVAVIYTLVQIVVSGTLSDPAATLRPIADSAMAVLGPRAAAAISIGALFSIYGYLSANMLHTPRLTFALAERGDIPAIFARIHPRFRTPDVSIVLYTVFLLAFTLAGSFRWNITLSAIVRLFAYGSIAIALLILRKRKPNADAFRLPGGPVLAIAAILFCVVLLVRAPLSNSTAVLVTAAAATLNWAFVRNRRAAA
ncbi:MAG: amino acid permease [Acidobacteria bacterium]|nr:amino acid permease [Acidobacteriota bacterium]